MRRATQAVAVGALLAGPTVIAFFSGGFAPVFIREASDFNSERLVFGALAWLLVLAAAVAAERPVPRAAAARVALAGLALLTVWTGLSLLWAPLLDPAGDDLQRLLLYLGVFAAAVAFLRGAAVRELVEPLLAAGIVIVVGYGLSERLLPDLVELERTTAADGRFEQPLTYWNAMGALAALGIVLCVRMAGDGRRPAWLRAGAAASAVPLAVGAYLAYSRGVLGALAIALLALAVLAPDRAQWRALAIALVPAVVAALLVEALPAVREFDGSDGARTREGLVMLAAAVVLGALAALLQRRAARAEAAGRLARERLGLPSWAPLAGAAAIVVLLAGVVALSASDRGPRAPSPTGANPDRLRSFESKRYEYWPAALEAFADEPIAGSGTAGFAVEWRQRRDIPERVVDAHSVYIETLAELGIAGFALLVSFLGAVAACARRAYRADAAAAAGPIAGALLWAVHAGVDWDWEMPALTLVALLLAGSLVAAADEDDDLPAATSADARGEQPITAAAA